jgi:hypothetical protein
MKNLKEFKNRKIYKSELFFNNFSNFFFKFISVKTLKMLKQITIFYMIFQTFLS